jgi:hypothetical protein
MVVMDMTKGIATRPVVETVLGLVRHARSAPATIRARELRRAELDQRNAPVPRVRRLA